MKNCSIFLWKMVKIVAKGDTLIIYRAISPLNSEFHSQFLILNYNVTPDLKMEISR